MTRKTFYNLSLLLPYIALLISGGLTYLVNGLDVFSSPAPTNLVTGTLILFTFTGIIWGPLYTWMVLVMLFWGRGKSADEIRLLYLLSPFLLACAMGFPVLLISLPESGRFMLWGILRMGNLDFLMPVFFENFYFELLLSLGLAWGLMAALCIVIGYIFVGGVLLMEKTMRRRGLFKEEKDPGQVQSAFNREDESFAPAAASDI